jgi:hypothetical protein
VEIIFVLVATLGIEAEPIALLAELRVQIEHRHFDSFQIPESQLISRFARFFLFSGIFSFFDDDLRIIVL